jgi:hypothetical protein
MQRSFVPSSRYRREFCDGRVLKTEHDPHADLPGEFYAYFTFVVALEFRGPNLKKKFVYAYRLISNTLTSRIMMLG